MKIKIEVDDSLTEEEVIIRCRELGEHIEQIQKVVFDAASYNHKLIFFKGEAEYYLPLSDILFFQTEGNEICVHTSDDIYYTRYKLYELESLLPSFFVRVSKSSILNVNRIFSINRNLSASSVVEFQQTHKQVYVSRSYYKALKLKLEEKRYRQ